MPKLEAILVIAHIGYRIKSSRELGVANVQVGKSNPGDLIYRHHLPLPDSTVLSPGDASVVRNWSAATHVWVGGAFVIEGGDLLVEPSDFRNRTGIVSRQWVKRHHESDAIVWYNREARCLPTGCVAWCDILEQILTPI